MMRTRARGGLICLEDEVDSRSLRATRREANTVYAVFFTVGTIFGAMGGVVELLIGINAEGKSLEAVTKPLSAADE